MDIYQERIRPLFDGSSETNAEIERKLGIPPKTINKWNTTTLRSYRNYIHQIASYFHVSTDYLLGNTDDPAPAGQEKSPPHGGELSKEVQEIIELYDKASPELRAAALAVLKSAEAAQTIPGAGEGGI